MPSSRKTIIAIGAALGLAQAVAQQGGAKKPKAANKDDAAPKSGEKKGIGDIELPVPEGAPQKSVNVPVYDAQGRKRMNFAIGVATALDKERIKLEQMRLEAFNEDGSTDYSMDLPDGMFLRSKQTLTTETKVKITRRDFELTGNSMSYNLTDDEGTLGGGVKMIIFDRNDMNAPKDEKTRIELSKDGKKLELPKKLTEPPKSK
jgi:Lipopolysaccharide-assembly, LptC-related